MTEQRVSLITRISCYISNVQKRGVYTFKKKFSRSVAVSALTAALFGLALTACSNDGSSGTSAEAPKIEPLAECTAPAFLKKGDKISQYLKKYDIPVMCGLPVGHDDVNLPIVMGAKVKIDVKDDGATLSFDMDGEKKTIETEKLTNKTTLSKALRKLLAGKLFSIEE